MTQPFDSTAAARDYAQLYMDSFFNGENLATTPDTWDTSFKDRSFTYIYRITLSIDKKLPMVTFTITYNGQVR